MADIALTYIVNPFAGFFKKVNTILTIAGYARASSELARMGYHKEAKYLMTEKLQQEID